MFRIMSNKSEEEIENEKLIEEIQQLHKSLALAYERYDYIVDDDLIEAAIYEIEALKARFRYMLALAKEKGLSSRLNNAIQTISTYSKETKAS